MTYDGLEPTLLNGFHKLAAQHGGGLVAGLGERLADVEVRHGSSAQIIALPGLHQRPQSRQPIYNRGEDGLAAENVIPFPRPKCAKNACRGKT